MVAIVAALGAGVFAASSVWEERVGTFSLTAVNYVFTDALTAMVYRTEFQEQSLLAAIGVVTAPRTAAAAPTGGVARSIPVLLYHGIVPNATHVEDVTPAQFKAQMFALKIDGWQTVSIYDFVNAMQGKVTLPPKSFLLTFDDGRKASYYPVDPVLQALGYRATMFVITGHSLAPGNENNPYYLSQSELETMLKSGRWDLQSHGYVGHADYPIDASGNTASFYGNKLWVPSQVSGEATSEYASRLAGDFMNYFTKHEAWPASPGHLETTAEYQNRIYNDLVTAKQDLENKLGPTVVSFAYPFSDYAANTKTDFSGSKTTLVNTVDQIYPVSFYQWFPGGGFSQNYPGVDGQLLKRMEPSNSWSGDYLASLLDEGQAKMLPFMSSSTSTAGWQATWGNASEKAGSLALRAPSSTTGAFAFLDGSGAWKGYTYTAQFDWGGNNESVTLVGDFQENVNDTKYLQCVFEKGNVRIEGDVNNTAIPIATEKDAMIGPGSNKNASIRFTSGGYVQCLWNGGVVASARMPASLPASGGIGAEIWSAAAGTASVTFTNVSVTGATR